MGVRDAVRRRFARLCGVEALQAVVDSQTAELAALRSELAITAQLAEARAESLAQSHADALVEVRAVAGAQHRSFDGLSARIDDLDPLHAALEHVTRWLEDHGTALAGLDARATALEPLVAASRHTTDWLRGHSTALDGVHVRLGELERAQAVATFTQWLDQVELATSPSISVVLPTRNRAALLPRAVASLHAQRYPNWELVVVDDAGDDHTPDVVAALADPRVRALRTPDSRGVGAARNAALAHATGEIVAYLDDDNTMHPLWLKAVAWAFGRHPDVDTVYGGFVVDDVERVDGTGSGGLPRLVLRPYDRERLLTENLADMGAIAHRAGLPAARFDESLTRLGDWDLLCALTADRDPLVLPAVACFYSTDAPHRLSSGPTPDADLATIRRKHGRAQ